MKKLFLVLSIIAIFTGLIYYRGNQMSEESNVPALSENPEVKVISVKKSKFTDKVNFVADLEPYEKAAVVAKIPGRTVLRVLVDEGQYVKKGDVLAKIDESLVRQDISRGRAALKRAVTQKETAKSDFERMKSLFEENVISEQKFDHAKAQYEAAQSQLEEAQASLKQLEIMLSYHSINASADGVISMRLIDPGDTTSQQKPAFMIYSQKKLRVTGSVPEKQFSGMAVGQRAEIKLDAFPGKVFNADVSRISPVIDPATRTGEVEVLLPSKGILKPGMYARVEIITGEHEGLAVPRDVLRKTPGTGNYSVFLFSDGKAKEKMVRKGNEENNMVEIISGLEAGDRVITTLSENIRDNAAVEVVSE